MRYVEPTGTLARLGKKVCDTEMLLQIDSKIYWHSLCLCNFSHIL